MSCDCEKLDWVFGYENRKNSSSVLHLIQKSIDSTHSELMLALALTPDWHPLLMWFKPFRLVRCTEDEISENSALITAIITKIACSLNKQYIL